MHKAAKTKQGARDVSLGSRYAQVWSLHEVARKDPYYPRLPGHS